jgi:NADPH2:quinone reductase
VQYVNQPLGKYPPPKGASPTLGLELSGRVVAVGAGTSNSTSILKEGDSVCALVPGGAYAEYCLAHHDSCLQAVVDPVPPLPKALEYLNLSRDPMVLAAAVPETVLTVWKNLFSKVEGSNR